VIARKKHPEAFRGILCLLTGGGLISVKLTFPLAPLLTLFHEARLSADRMKGFIDVAPADVRD
jgi:hypothetical protein